MRRYSLIIVSIIVLSVIASYAYRELEEGKAVSEASIYYQVISILNEREVDAWLNNNDLLDEDPFLDVDYTLLNSRWLEGPHPSGESTVKVGRYVIYLERTPATERRTGEWERSIQ